MTETVCERCNGQSWILDGTDDAGNDFYRPCHECNPELYARFMDGHLAPGHTCSQCANRPRPRRPKTHKPDPPATTQLVPNEEPPPTPDHVLEMF